MLSVIYGVIVAVFFWPSPLSIEHISHDPSFVNEMSSETQIIVEELEFEDLSRRKQAAFDEAMTALRNADKAGNVDDARKLAVIARKLKPSAAPAFAPAWASAPIVLKMPNDHEFQIPGNSTEEQAKLVGREYMRVLNEFAVRNRHAAILKGFLVWLIPSILYAVLGLSFSWVRRGFQGQHPN